MTDPFREIEQGQKDEANFRLECPRCGAVKRKRRDSLAVGLHSLICVNCGYTTDKIQTAAGTIKEKVASDHR